MEERMEYFNGAQAIAGSLKFALSEKTEPIKDAAQHPLDIADWTEFFLDHKINSMIELGTGSGAFSLWLRKHVPNFLTFDNAQPYHDIPEFKLLDIFANIEEIGETMESMPRPFLLYCDNGDKAREVRELHKWLYSGDYLATHDFQIEIHPEDIPINFTLLRNNSLTAFFIKDED